MLCHWLSYSGLVTQAVCLQGALAVSDRPLHTSCHAGRSWSIEPHTSSNICYTCKYLGVHMHVPHTCTVGKEPGPLRLGLDMGHGDACGLEVTTGVLLQVTQRRRGAAHRRCGARCATAPCCAAAVPWRPWRACIRAPSAWVGVGVEYR